jgi:hypothetical protein
MNTMLKTVIFGFASHLDYKITKLHVSEARFCFRLQVKKRGQKTAIFILTGVKTLIPAQGERGQ